MQHGLNRILEIITLAERLKGLGRDAAGRDAEANVFVTDAAKFASAMSTFGLDGRGRPGYFGRNHMDGNRVKNNGGLSAVMAVGEFLQAQLGKDAYALIANNPNPAPSSRPVLINNLRSLLGQKGIPLNIENDAQGMSIHLEMTVSPEQQAGIVARADTLYRERTSGVTSALTALQRSPLPDLFPQVGKHQK